MLPPPPILVVDDDPDVRRITVLLLRQGGYSPLEAEGGVQALDVLATLTDGPPLLITDLRMPGMSGEELARAALRRHPGLKVLFVTGFSTDAVAAAALAPDRVAVLEKPFTLPQLLQRVREVLDG